MRAKEFITEVKLHGTFGTMIPTMGINIRSDGNIDYASLIVDGEKKYESRKTDSLRPYVGKTVGIVRTGNGPAVAIGQVTIGEPIVVDAEKFNKLRKQHLVPQGSKFDIDSDGTKYLYPMINPVRWDNEKPIKHRGIVSRKIQEHGVVEGSGKNVVKSIKVGNFRHDLVDTGMGWQVRIYNGDELYDTGMSKNSEQKGLAALEDAVAYTEKQTRTKRQGVAEDQENFNGIDISMEIQKDDEYVDDEDYDNQVIYVTASSKGKELGHVLFAFDGEYLMPQDLEVEERYRGQGIAQTMYDYVKSKGYKIRRSGQQTDAGTGFWDKHKPGKNVWEQGVAEGSGFDQEAGIGIDGKSFKFKIRDLVALADNYPVTKIDPQQFSKQIAGRDEDSTQSMARAEKADLQYPIIVVKRQNGQLWIADGTHRAHKAIMHKLPSINAKIIPIKDMAPFDVDQGVAEGSESAIQKIEKKIQAKRDALGLAREQRRARGQHQQGQREIKIQAEIDRLSNELTQLKKQGVAEGKMAELDMDLEDPEISDRQFEKMYGMTRKEARELFSKTNMWDFPQVRDHNKPLHEQGVAEGSESLDYQGNCTEDDVVDDIFGDVNNFANMVEKYGDEFTRGNLVVKYDPKKDVHYFYYKKQGMAESDLDRFKKYIRPVVKTTPKIEKTTNPAGRTTDHVEWIVTSDTGEKRRFDSKKEAQEFYDLCTKQGVAEDMSQRDPVIRTVADFYINDVGSVHKEPLEDYVAQAKDLLSKVEDRSMKAKILDILKQAKKNPYIQGSVITAVGAILAGSVLGSAQKFGLSPTQTNMALQAILNTVIPTMVSRVNGRDWPETLKYTLASVGMGVGSAGMMENFKDGKNPQDKGDSARHGIPKNATISQLKKIRSSDNSSPRKKQLAHWQINMRQGRK